MFPYRWYLRDLKPGNTGLKVFSTFACGGGSTMGWKLAGYDVIAANDIDPRMAKVYKHNHNPKHYFLCPIGELLDKELPKELYNLDVLDGSPPCFSGEVLVMTDRGFKEIRSVEVGDRVLTHTNSFNVVRDVMSKGVKECYNLKLQGSVSMRVTGEHPFYVREMSRVGRKGVRSFSEPYWKGVKDLGVERNSSNMVKRRDYIGIAVNNKKIVPEYESIVMSKEFLYIVGRWMGDGWLKFFENERFFSAYCSEKCRKSYGRKLRRPNRSNVVICCGKNEVEELRSRFDLLNYSYRIDEQRTSYRFTISNKSLCKYFKQFGRGAKNKRLTQDILDLPVELLESFLKGYLDADGSYDERKQKWRCCSVSRELIFGIQHCVHKVYKVPTTMTIKDNSKYSDEIEGRKVNFSIAYDLHFYTETKKQQHGFYEDGYLWVPFRDKEKIIEGLKVYNLSVEEDESYTVNNFICHNCSTFSLSGQREKGYKKEKKFKEGQAKQVLSDLFFDWIKLVDKLQPKVAMAENVKGMLMTNAIPYVKKVVAALNDIGYSTQIFSLNVASMGVPQKRERVFFICKRKDLELPDIRLNFNEKPIPFNIVSDNTDQDISRTTPQYVEYWNQAREGEPVGKFQSIRKVKYNEPCNTINASNGLYHPKICRILNKRELCLVGSYPLDYDFLGLEPRYLIGMSVPPVAIAQIAHQIKKQLLTFN